MNLCTDGLGRDTQVKVCADASMAIVVHGLMEGDATAGPTTCLLNSVPASMVLDHGRNHVVPGLGDLLFVSTKKGALGRLQRDGSKAYKLMGRATRNRRRLEENFIWSKKANNRSRFARHSVTAALSAGRAML